MFNKIIFLFLILCTTSVFASNNNQQYSIDLIIFTHINNQSLYSEHWTNELIQPIIKNAVELLAPDSPLLQKQTNNGTPISQNYILRPSQLFGLKKEALKLSKDSNYKIVLRLSWLQDRKSLEAGRWIHLIGGQPYDGNGQLIDANLSDQKPTYWEINGKLKIRLNHYFNINTQLYLTLPQSVTNGDTTAYKPIPLQTFKMIESRRTRSNELNYFDHPLFGMLLKISKYEAPHV